MQILDVHGIELRVLMKMIVNHKEIRPLVKHNDASGL